jgi:hypothetical protein
MAKTPNSALQLAQIICGHFPAKQQPKVGVFFDKSGGWRAVVYGSSDSSAGVLAQIDRDCARTARALPIG